MGGAERPDPDPGDRGDLTGRDMVRLILVVIAAIAVVALLVLFLALYAPGRR